MANFFTKLFGTHSSHELKKIYPIADKVDALEEQYKKLTDAELRAKTDEFKAEFDEVVNSLRRVTRTAKRSTTCCLRRLRRAARRRGACWVCGTTACR